MEGVEPTCFNMAPCNLQGTTILIVKEPVDSEVVCSRVAALGTFDIFPHSQKTFALLVRPYRFVQAPSDSCSGFPATAYSGQYHPILTRLGYGSKGFPSNANF